MGSMALSTFMMFTPRAANFIFLTICCVGFFGIYVPYNESKKKGEVWAPIRWLRRIADGLPRGGKSARRDRGEFDHISSIAPGKQHRLEQLESLKSAGLMDDREYREKRQKILNGR